MSMITFTPIECEVLMHRLEFLAQTDDLDELFAGESEAEITACTEGLIETINGGGRSLQVHTPAARKVLVEAIEGCTIHEMADEAELSNTISAQKKAAYHKAIATAAAKITFVTGIEVRLP
jgi:hypothetical protein